MKKLRLKPIYLLVAGIAIIYSSCKKSSTAPKDPALTPQAVSSQVALTINQSLFGGLGAFDASGGLTAPTTFAVHTKGKVLQSLSNPDCGQVVDTTVNFTFSANGSSATIAGDIAFTFTCTNGVYSGFTTADNIAISLTGPDTSLTYKVAENLTLLSSNPSDPYADFSINGSLNSDGSYKIISSKQSGSEVFDYTLKSVVYSPTAGDIVSGSGTFNTSGSGPKGSWNYTGTIVFNGNQMATITINGKAYNVNLQTGVVS